MKNKLLSLLVLACAAFVSFPVMAQTWTAPVPVGSTLADDGQYYLYNTGAGQFLKNGNSWWTQASLGDDGIRFLLNDSTGVDATVSGWTIQSKTPFLSEWSGELVDKYVFMVNATEICVDMGSQGHNFWKFEDQGNKVYRFKITDADAVYGLDAEGGIYANTYVGWDGQLNADGTKASTRVVPLDNGVEGYENAALDWVLVTEDAYQAFIARKALYTQLVRAAEFPSVSTSEAGIVYTSSTATAEEITAAAEALKKDIDANMWDAATEENPIDLTHLIVNPTCEDASGWTGAVQDGGQKPNSFAYQGSTKENADKGITISKFLENWCASSSALPDKKMYQIIKNVPQGRYKLEADVVATRQNNESLQVSGVYLFADGGILQRQSVHSGNGIPEHFALDFTVLNDSIIIGFETLSTDANWVGVDNFKLSFFGKDPNAVKGALLAKISECEVNVFNQADSYYGEATATTFDAAIAAATALYADANASDDDMKAAITELDSLNFAVLKEVEAYNRLYQLWDQVSQDRISTYSAAGFDNVVEAIEDMAQDWEDAYYDRTYNTADVDSAYALLDKTIQDGVKETLNGPDGAGKELTALLNNANFDKQAGWEGSGYALGHGSAEVFNATFDIHQTLTGLPNGKYTVKVQAFYRTSDFAAAYTAWADKTENVRLFVYGNDTEKACKSLLADRQDNIRFGTAYEYGGEKGDWTWDNIDQDGKWTPNCMQSARIYFDEGLYDNEVTCVVTDGTLKIGIKCVDPVIAGNHWSLFDNFRVFYAGNSTSDYEDAIYELIEKAQTVSDQVIVTGATSKIEEAIMAGMDALSIDADACIAAIDQLREAIAYGEKSITLVEEVAKAAEEYGIKMANVTSSYTGMQDLMDEIAIKADPDMAYEFGMYFESNEEVETAIANLKSGWAMYVLFDHLSTASESNPAEATAIIDNPSFVYDNANSGEFWPAEGTANHGIYEIFNKNFDFYQTLVGLPVGYYKATVQGFYRFAGHNSTPGAEARRDSIAKGQASEPIYAYMYAENSEFIDSTQMVSIFAGASSTAVSGSGEEDMQSILGGNSPIYCPKTMEAASIYMAPVEEGGADLYHGNEVIFYVAEGVTETKIGLRKTKTQTNDWVAFDNFQLFYLGQSAPTAIEGVGADKAVAKVAGVKYYAIDGKQVVRPAKGITIVVETLEDGTVNRSKQIVK